MKTPGHLAGRFSLQIARTGGVRGTVPKQGRTATGRTAVQKEKGLAQSQPFFNHILADMIAATIRSRRRPKQLRR